MRGYGRRGACPRSPGLGRSRRPAHSLSDAQAYMGHADVTTTMIYVHHVPKRNAAKALTALVADHAKVGNPDVPLTDRIKPHHPLRQGTGAYATTAFNTLPTFVASAADRSLG